MSLTPALVRAPLTASTAPKQTPPPSETTTPNLSIKHLHHHAFFCRDSEETRRFYEDILGLPLTQTVVMEDDIEFFKGSYCHLFFSLADGSSIAFFDYPGLREERVPPSLNAFEHHLALEVENEAAQEHYQRRLTATGVESKLIDHQVYRSLYFDDPNGLHLELLIRTPLTQEHERTSLKSAHAELKRWTERRSTRPEAKP